MRFRTPPPGRSIQPDAIARMRLRVTRATGSEQGDHMLHGCSTIHRCNIMRLVHGRGHAATLHMAQENCPSYHFLRRAHVRRGSLSVRVKDESDNTSRRSWEVDGADLGTWFVIVFRSAASSACNVNMHALEGLRHCVTATRICAHSTHRTLGTAHVPGRLDIGMKYVLYCSLMSGCAADTDSQSASPPHQRLC